MKRFNLPPLFALIISMQMIFSPLAGAQSALEIMNMGSQAVGMLMGGGQQGPSPQTQAQLAILRQQARPVPDKYFNQAVLSRIPGLVPYLTKNGIPFPVMECPQLPAKPVKVRAAVCTEGPSGDANNPMALQGQIFEADAYKQAYTFLEEEYDSYLTTATSATKKQGVGCMDEARQILSGFFQYRMNELDSLVNKLEAINNQFEEASKADLNAIEEITALLEGGGSELYNEVKSRSNNPDLFDFSKKFQDPACTAMFSPERFNDTGLERGFNGISKLLRQTYEAPAGKYSAQSFPQAAATVETDIRNMATKVATQARLNFKSMAEGNDMTAFIRGLRSNISSTTGSNASLSADLFADVQTSFLEKNDKLRTSTVEVISELRAAGVDASSAVTVMADRNASTFDSAVTTIENNLRNNCLEQQLGSVETLVSRVTDLSASNFANKGNPNILKDRIEKIFSNPDTSPEQKLRELRLAEQQTANRYNLRMDRSSIAASRLGADGTIITEQVATREINTPSKYIDVLIKNCDAIYKTNTLNNMSAQKAISTLRNLRRENEQLAENTARELQNTITNKLLECPGETAGNTVGSCEPSRFNNSSPGFCARVANVCAGKMRACTEQTKQFVATQKVQRDARKKSYNTQMTANKQKIIALFDTTMAQYKLEADAMNAQFGIGFTPPTGILREVPEGSRYLGKLAQATNGSEDGALLLEDPKQFVKMFTANINNLKDKVKAQQDGIMGNGGTGGIIGNHIAAARRNMETAKTEMRTLARECDRKITDARRQYEENQRRMAEETNRRNEELGERRQEICNTYSMAQVNPQAGCDGNLSDLMAADRTATSDLAAYCREGGFNSEDGGASDDAVTICIQMDLTTSANARFRPACEVLIGEGDSANDCREAATNSEGVAIPNRFTTDSECIRRKEVLVRALHREQRNSGDESLSMPEAPAYCAAGDNSDRFTNPFGIGGNSGSLAGAPAGFGM